MNYETVYLAIDPATAHERITERVSGIRTRRFHGRYEYTSPLGYHLAELSEARLPNRSRGAKLKYRTTMLSPVAAHARRLAHDVRDAVSEYRVQGY